MILEQETTEQRVRRKLPKKQHNIAVAAGREKADLVLKNACYLNVFSNELCFGDIAVSNGLIVGMGDYSGKQEADMSGKVVVPGLIDAHIHLESSLCTPAEFARAVVRHGTTTVITDPHEIANVMGKRGIEYMLAATRELPIDVHFMLPSCVPASPADESGAALDFRDIDEFYEEPRVLGLAEMMNYPGVIGGDEEPISKILASQSHHKKIDGHAPALSGRALNAYITAGVYSDHECSDLDNALEKLRKGQFIMIREGTAAKNLEALCPLICEKYYSRCMFATDDKHPGDLKNGGHIDYIVKKAIALGADPLLAVKTASHNAARYFLLNNKGAVAPGYLADLAVVDSLENFRVLAVYKKGRLVFDSEEVIPFAEPQVEESLTSAAQNTVHIAKVTKSSFAIDRALPVIGMIGGEIVTTRAGTAEGPDPERDVLKAAVIERHFATGHIGVGLIKGYGLKRGAVATSIAHDSHNIIAVGADDGDMALAVNETARMNGGIAVVSGGKIVASLPLPIAGLMSREPLETVDEKLETAKRAAYSLGVSPDVDPFMSLSFMSLPVIPELRLTTRGVYDVSAGKYL